MSHELIVLTLAGLWQMIVMCVYSARANRELGSGYAMSARDREPSREMSIVTARWQRAYNNHIEWLLMFAIAVTVTELSEQNSILTALCAWAYLAARVAYVPAYVLGWRPGRSLIWTVGFLATGVMLVAALF
ncbi:MAG: MAPEG family protein [Pseudomonadota bacterium]